MWSVGLGFFFVMLHNLFYEGIHRRFVGGDGFKAVLAGGRFCHAADAESETGFAVGGCGQGTEIFDGAGAREHDGIGAGNSLALPFGEFCHRERFVDHPAGRLREELEQGIVGEIALQQKDARSNFFSVIFPTLAIFLPARTRTS